VLLKLVTVDPTAVNEEKLLHPAPVQRSIKYWVIVPPVSVAAVQERLICAGLAAVDVRAEGAVKVGAAVVAEAVLE
jgi:hypothetical protein